MRSTLANENRKHANLIRVRLRYHKPMKKPPDNPEFARFTEAMRHIMTVPKTAIREREEATKKQGKRLGRKKPGSKAKVL